MEPVTLDQATKILSVFGETSRGQVQDVLESGLSADLRDANLNGPIDRDAVRRLLGLKPLNLLLLEEIGTVAIPAIAERFVARYKFVFGYSEEDPVKISFLHFNFKQWLQGKTEEPMVATELRYAKLVEASIDGPILKELGDKAETTLAHIWVLMEHQSNRENGVLLTNGQANIFYVRDADGVLRMAGVRWLSGGWNVIAHSVVRRQRRWHGGERVFSRNS